MVMYHRRMTSIAGFSDEELAVWVRTHDQEAYIHLVRRYEKKLLRYARTIVNDPHMAADVIQEAFIKAFINLHGFNPKRKFSSWIYAIVHNEAINAMKKVKKTISIDDAELILPPSRKDDNPETTYEKKEMQHLLSTCLARLPLIYREPLLLYYLEEKSYGEISDILRVPMGTVAIRIHRGKQMAKVLCTTIGDEIHNKNIP